MTLKRLDERLQLYLVTDEQPDVRSLCLAVREAIHGGVTAVQLRRKRDDGRQLVEIGRALRQITMELGALYIVNDRVDIALLTDADGVHVGQSDIACRDVRALIGDKLIGVSASTVDEAKAAVEDGADYLGVGSIYPTSSKPDADFCPLPELARIVEAVTIPVVAIGGITKARTPEVLSSGAHGVAVVSAIMSAADPRSAAAELRSALSAR